MNRIGEERVGLNMSRILIVEDEVAIADLEKDYLELSDFQVDICNSGDEGLNMALSGDYNLVILDEAPVTFGDNVFVAPNCGFYTAGHPVEAALRNKGLEYARPIVVGDNVWFGAGVSVLPGVIVGDNCVIGAGSVVTKDIPANSVAAGNPCKVSRTITELDKHS